ncbi:MAG: ester cyclase [Chloroflexota bacterium]
MLEANKTLIRRFYDQVWNTGEFWAADDLVAPTYVRHGPQEIHGRDGIREVVGGIRAAFPDLFITIEDLIAEGDRVAVRWHAYGTHRGEFRGCPPTGRAIQVMGITVSRFANAQIVEEWAQWDTSGLMNQLGGLVPERRVAMT